MKSELYGFLHKTAKRVLKRNNDLPDLVALVSFPETLFKDEVVYLEPSGFVNEVELAASGGLVSKETVYPVENLAPVTATGKLPLSFTKKHVKLHFATSLSDATKVWHSFIDASVISAGYRNEGIHYAGYIKECSQWCLPSWVWTNAAIVRYYAASGQVERARDLCDKLIALQDIMGGWVVRNDYSKDGILPELAPNDSCYIALNSCLSLYETTKEEKYLQSAIRCANWVIETARQDGLVYFAFDQKRREWIKNRNIVDIGFTAGLFARLYEVTREERYLVFLKRFTEKYIDVFYMPSEKCFATAVDGNDQQHGGAFGRGQGWALEGLIPAYRVLKDDKTRKVIAETVETLLKLQQKDGGWAYNLLKPVMGIDCKAVPIIARCLLEWEADTHDMRLYKAAEKALDWCALHTAVNGEAAGGIFSYTTEGAVVHHMYTSTAFVYGSSYALEVYDRLKGLG